MRTILIVCLLCACGKGGGDAIDKGGPESKGGVTKVSEAALHLNAIAKKAKLVFGETGKFPVGTSKVLPVGNADSAVGGGCCGSKSSGGSVDNKCAVSKDWAADPVWKALEFSIDEPTLNRYKYESADGMSFTATAAGDADCDGEEAVYVLKGTVANGSPNVELVPPPKGKY
jgi:hypothetical protein